MNEAVESLRADYNEIKAKGWFKSPEAERETLLRLAIVEAVDAAGDVVIGRYFDWIGPDFSIPALADALIERTNYDARYRAELIDAVTQLVEEQTKFYGGMLSPNKRATRIIMHDDLVDMLVYKFKGIKAKEGE